jgi:type IV secretion system protein VirD4
MYNQFQQKKETSQLKNYTIAIFLVFFLLTVISLIATQYLADIFNYSPALGNRLYDNYYNPYSWIVWSINYTNSYPDVFKPFFMVMSGVIAAVFSVFIVIRLVALRKSKKYDSVHGTAHWASYNEIKESQLLDNSKGVFIGAYEYKGRVHYLRHNGPEHILAFAPTRSGKGVGLVIPTLLSWSQSALIVDIKAELWALTAGWRQKYAKNKVMKFDPTCADNSGVKYNALESIRLKTIHEVKDVQNICEILVEKENHNGKGDYFQKAAFSFLTGMILHLLYKADNEDKRTPNLATVFKAINDPARDIYKILEEMITYKHLGNKSHETVATIARGLANKADQELSGVVGTATETLNIYADPLIEKNIEYSEFKIDDLMDYEQPISLYLILKPSDKDRLRPVIKLLVNQILRKRTENELKFKDGQGVKDYKYELLLMGDEIAALGRLDILQESLAYMAGYGIKGYFIIQDIAQLYGLYTRDESIMSNCHTRIAYAPNKIETAEILSKMSGVTTVVKSHTTTSGKRTSLMLGNVSESYQEVQRPLITADECMRLPGPKKDSNKNIIDAGDMLIFQAGKAPIYGKQILFFKDPVFLERSKVEAPKNSDKTIEHTEKINLDDYIKDEEIEHEDNNSTVDLNRETNLKNEQANTFTL